MASTSSTNAPTPTPVESAFSVTSTPSESTGDSGFYAGEIESASANEYYEWAARAVQFQTDEPVVPFTQSALKVFPLESYTSVFPLIGVNAKGELIRPKRRRGRGRKDKEEEEEDRVAVSYEIDVENTRFYPNETAEYIQGNRMPTIAIEFSALEPSDDYTMHWVNHTQNTLYEIPRVVITGKPHVLVPPASKLWYKAAINLYKRAGFIGVLVLPKHMKSQMDLLHGIVEEHDEFYAISTHDWTTLYEPTPEVKPSTPTRRRARRGRRSARKPESS